MHQAKPEPLEKCPDCGCPDLFIRKDFPQKLGLLVVVAAALAFCILAANPHTLYLGFWVLSGAAVVDAVLYLLVPRATVCYRCRRTFRGVLLNPKHEGFELSIAEKYRTP
jgi:hypothetical protein